MVYHLDKQIYFSSTLMTLKINVCTLFDCIRLLDGRFESLSTLIVTVRSVCDYPVDISNTVSIISIIMIRNETINEINFVVFVLLESNFHIEMFFIDYIGRN